MGRKAVITEIALSSDAMHNARNVVARVLNAALRAWRCVLRVWHFTMDAVSWPNVSAQATPSDNNLTNKNAS